MAFKPIEILINAKDNASAVFTSLQAKVVAVGTVIATYFGITAFAGVVKGAADFEQAMSRVKAATGASADEMARLRKVAEDAGANTQFTSVEAAAALENLAKAGLNANDAIAALPAVMQLASAGGTDLGQASEFITKAVMGMGLAFADAGRVADVLALGANATNTSVTGLAQALSYAAPVANSLGLSLESTVAIIGKFADAGIDASRAGTALNSILSQFANPASKFRDELAAAGITTGNFDEALRQLAVAGPLGSKAINAVGLEAGPALRALLNQGMGALDDLTAKLKNAEGSAAATAKVMQDNLNGSLTGLSSAWETVKNVLGTPVLPVIKDGVDQLSAALKSAVADGTVARFGEAIATAFQAGIKWVREFLGTVDFAKLLADLQAFAARAGEFFDRVGESAKNAGAVVQTAYGAIQTSGNALLAGLYGTATGLTLVIQGVLKGLELLYLASSKITFGDVSKQYAGIAEDLRIQSEAMGAAVDALGVKVRESMGGVVDGVGNAVGGFTKLTTSIGGAESATEGWAKTVAAATAELSTGADALRQSELAYRKQVDANNAAAAASAQHEENIKLLQEAYDGFIRAGNLNEAIITFDELTKALRENGTASKDAARAAADAAAQIEAAFGRLGVTSAADLKRQAEAAQRDYATIKEAGTSTAEDISNAFKVAAEKAIAANKGVAPSWVEAEAATRGYRIEIDEAGKATLKLRDEVENVGRTTANVGPGMQREWKGVAGSINAAGQALDDYQRRMQKTYGRPGEGDRNVNDPNRTSTRGEKMGAGVEEIGTGGSQFRNKDGWTSDALGRAQTQGIWTRTAIIDYLTSAGLDELIATKLSEQFIDANGNVPYEANDVQKKWAGKFGTLSEALGKMAEFYKFDDQGQMEAAQLLDFERKRRLSPQQTNTQPITQGGGAGGSGAGGNGGGLSASRGGTPVIINLDGVSRTINTDAAGARNLQQVLRALSDGKSVS